MVDSRQQRRAQRRAAEWYRWKCDLSETPIGPTDEHGVIPRRIRRKIALRRAKAHPQNFAA